MRDGARENTVSTYCGSFEDVSFQGLCSFLDIVIASFFPPNFLHYAKLIADKIYKIAVSCHCSVISLL